MSGRKEDGKRRSRGVKFATIRKWIWNASRLSAFSSEGRSQIRCNRSLKASRSFLARKIKRNRLKVPNFDNCHSQPNWPSLERLNLFSWHIFCSLSLFFSCLISRSCHRKVSRFIIKKLSPRRNNSAEGSTIPNERTGKLQPISIIYKKSEIREAGICFHSEMLSQRCWFKNNEWLFVFK